MPAIRDALEATLAAIADPAGEGARICLSVYAEPARAAADAADARARNGLSLGAIDGMIITIKDLFDVAGETTRAGSKVLVGKPAARQDAPVVTRLRQAGAVIVAKTNMSEFAFTGIGRNPHYGTPGNPVDRSRAPGGSSSGAAVAVADGIGRIGIGTDTGGSTRIPAAFCGIVGLKPTQKRVPTTGAYPLSFTLDSIGPMAKSVADCALADAVMAGEAPAPLMVLSVAGLRLGVVGGFALQDIDGIVGPAYESALKRLAKAGVRLTDVDLEPIIADMRAVNARGGFSAVEAAAIHAGWLDDAKADVDEIVRYRITAGSKVMGSAYVEMQRARPGLIGRMEEVIAPYDALVWPTTPIVAPKLADIESKDAFVRANTLALRNTNPVNFFDGCAMSLPIHGAELPVGLMLVGRHGEDRRLMAVAQAIEGLLGPA
jgi:aspartyl-tRNA(Asn)/glutamyl-tRNA(Gln) amidotransferase subunit A